MLPYPETRGTVASAVEPWSKRSVVGTSPPLGGGVMLMLTYWLALPAKVRSVVDCAGMVRVASNGRVMPSVTGAGAT
jgi:hypothetical protein